MSNTRREFLEQSLFAAAAAALAGASTIRADDEAEQSKSPNERLRIACVGVRGRGGDHIQNYLKRSDVEIAAIVDADEEVAHKRIGQIEKKTKRKPAFYQDMRKMLEDKNIDAVSIATPNHWHALAAIWAIQAGKDVYVEKPVSHNVSEGRRIVQTARKHNKIVQTGTQSRSNPGMRAAIEFVQSGKIGEVKLARGLCYKRRGSIGPKGNYEIPKSVNYSLWSGPAQIKPLTRKNLHYDWHWMWDYGNGDLGNQGIHQMDIARWGLGATDIGTSVLSYGGRLGYTREQIIAALHDDNAEKAISGPVEDAGESANTQVSVHDFADGKRLVFEVRGLKTPHYKGTGVGVIFYGTEGVVVLPSYSGGVAFDRHRNQIARFSGGDDPLHYANFIKAVRSRKTSDLNADILEGHLSSALCHLGNVSYRLGDQLDGKVVADRLHADDETAETFERFSDHLWYNDVTIADSTAVRFGKKLAIDPKAESFTGTDAAEANSMLTRDYRAPFVVPAEKDV